jgi:hypothetical protein
MLERPSPTAPKGDPQTAERRASSLFRALRQIRQCAGPSDTMIASAATFGVIAPYFSLFTPKDSPHLQAFNASLPANVHRSRAEK